MQGSLRFAFKSWSGSRPEQQTSRIAWRPRPLSGNIKGKSRQEIQPHMKKNLAGMELLGTMCWTGIGQQYIEEVLVDQMIEHFAGVGLS